MVPEGVTESMKREVWRRDDFTCRYCGRIVVWEDLRLVPAVGPEGTVEAGTDGLISVCSKCLDEGKSEPVPDEGDRKLLKLKRDMEELSASDEDMVLDRDRTSGKLAFEKKIKDLGAENQRLLGELNDKTAMAIAYKKKLDRALQDLDNNRKRTENEVTLKVRDRTKGLALSIMGSLEDLDRALKDTEKRRSDPKTFDGLLAGIKGIRKALISQLSGSGIEVLDPLGSPFDPNFHEALGSIEDKSKPSDTIVMVMSPGCLLDGKLLKPARVMVSKGGPKRPKEMPSSTAEGTEAAVDPDETMECTDEEDWEAEKEPFEMENGGPPMQMGPPSKEDKKVPVIIKRSSLKRCRKKKA